MSIKFNHRTGLIETTGASGLVVKDAGGTDSITIQDTGSLSTIGTNANDLTISAQGGLSNVRIDNGSNLHLRNAADLVIYDGSNVASMTFAHVGSDFDITGSSVTDINLTGVTAINAGTVDADFDAITATSYGGIVEAELLGSATTHTLTNKTFDANGTGNSLSNVDVADLANGTDGELITWSAAGTPTTVATGTATHVLTSNGPGTAPTFQAPASGTPTAITVADSTDATSFPAFFESATGDLGPKTDASNYTYNATTGALTAGSFSGDGSALTSLTAANISAGSLASGVNHYFSANSTNAAFAVPFLGYTGAAAGNYGMSIDTVASFTYNPSTNTLSAGTFSGSGASLTSLTAANISSGNLGSGVLPYATASATSSAFKVPFLNTTGNTSGNYGLLHDSSNASPSYNPSTETMSVTVLDATSITATTIGGILATNLLDKSATETITGTWSFDGSVTESDFGTGAKVKDGTDVLRPVGMNVMPVYEIDANDSFDLAHNGMLWHKDANAAVTFTCDNDATIPQGACWVVHNDDTENLTIAQGTGVTVYWTDGSGAPTAGNVTVEQGGIVTVYKYTDTEFWVWGAKSAAGGGISNVVEDTTPQLGGDLDVNGNTIIFDDGTSTTENIEFGTGTDFTMYFDGTDLQMNGAVGVRYLDTRQNTAGRFIVREEAVVKFQVQHDTDLVTIHDGYALQIQDSADTDFVTMSHDGTNFNITGTNTSQIRVNDNLAVRGGNTLSVYDSGGGDYISIGHDGTDVNINTLGAASVNLNQTSSTSFSFDGLGGVQPWFTIDSLSTNGNWTEQGAGISVGESGKKGSAAIHMTYRGDGKGWIGMGAVNDTGETGGTPGFGHIAMTYNNNQVQVGGRLYPGVSGTAATTQATSYIEDASGQNYGSINVAGATGTSGTYAGYSINQRVVLMNNNSTTSGLYDDTNNEWHWTCVQNGAMSIYHNGIINLDTRAYNSTGVTTGARVRHHRNVQYDVGLNTLPVHVEDASDTLEAGHCGAVYFKDGTTGITLTLLASSSTDFPVHGVTTIINANATGNITVTEGASTTLFYLDGSTRTDTTGGCTVGPGGVATIWREATTVYYIWGSGITP